MSDRTSKQQLQPYSWGCECGHVYSVTDSPNGAWYSRATVDAEIERLTEMVDGKLLEDRDYLLAQNVQLRTERDSLFDSRTEAYVERDRLRSVLERIVKEYEPGYSTWDFVGIAKNALRGADEPGAGT